MFKLQSRDRDLLVAILTMAVTFGIMLLLIHMLGEIHGLISTVIMLLVQISFLHRRVSALEHELRISHEIPDTDHSKLTEKNI
ncbi:MAG TPA: hypothetical protein VG938_00580 [Verrucomicrobiae bacterium]|jgi:hypothetical protein|nr:hypothetical protein [Verrucomicrobiae bacterium]